MKLTDIAFHRDSPIYAKELHQYRRDSNHAARQRKARRSRISRINISGSLSRIFNRTTLPNSAVSVLAIVALPLVASIHA